MVALNFLTDMVTRGFDHAINHVVIPAEAGIHELRKSLVARWIPAFAGMTDGAFVRVIHASSLAGPGKRNLTQHPLAKH